jgi:hypothetical protein
MRALPFTSPYPYPFASQIVYSSRGVAFYVLSEKTMVAGIQPPPTPSTLAELVAHCASLYLGGVPHAETVEDDENDENDENKENIDPNVPLPPVPDVWVDFEGEMLGYSGEMVSAQFLLRSGSGSDSGSGSGSDSDSTPTPAPTPGLLVDMTSPTCIALAKRILECGSLRKIGWGIESDVASLMHQHTPVRLDIHPTNMVDAQLCTRFSASAARWHRKSLARALRDVSPRELLKGLPRKDGCIEWDACYARHTRAMPFPLTPEQCGYAIDDLHRIELVVTHSSSSRSSRHTNRLSLSPHPISEEMWAAAARLSETVTDAIRTDMHGMDWLNCQITTYETGMRKSHPIVKMLSRAVAMQRHHIHLLRLLRRDDDHDDDTSPAAASAAPLMLSPSDTATLQSWHDSFADFLQLHGVHIPENLSFSEPLE